MKKYIALFFALLLTCCCGLALAEEPLEAEEVRAFCERALAYALTLEPVEAEDIGSGFYSFVFDGVALVCTGDTLTEDSDVVYAEVYGGEETLCDARGIVPGSLFEDALAAYPLDNPGLTGAYDEAALYISGVLPDPVRCGILARDGSRPAAIQHSLYTVDGDAAEVWSVGFLFEDGAVDSVYAGVQADTADGVRECVAQASALQENRAYSAYRAEEPEPLAREDLLFVNRGGRLDFVGAGEDALTALLGSPEADTWEQEDGAYLRTLEWEGVTAALRYDAQKQNGRLVSLLVYGDALEGPRGLHMNDTIESALDRFPEMAEGDLAVGEQSVTAAFTASLEDGGAVALTLDFVDGLLYVITCAYAD